MNTENIVRSDEMTASYCPEDNRLRLYVGRVPRLEYEALRAEGWTSTPKQNCQFVATWTPERRNTALAYGGGFIEDEDQAPAERAADRAERFSGYRDKRTAEAIGHADRYDAGRTAHGYQSQARAERAAARHDRIADRAGDAWGKAEYWTSRTAGVIGHALYRSAPGVRMGRIKTIEAEQRKELSNIQEKRARWDAWTKIAGMSDASEQTKAALAYAGGYGACYSNYLHPRAATHPREYYRTNPVSLYSLLSDEQEPITGAEACALFFSDHREPKESSQWSRHFELRLAYENQMLAAAGGMLEQCEVLPGGKLGGKLIIKVSKSSVTKRATSCDIIGPKVSGWTYKAANIPGTEYAAYKFDLERIAPGAYAAPTPESLAELKAFNDSRKASAPKKAVCPLINPRDADAERLQAVWNERAKARHIESHMRQYSKDYASEFVPATVCRVPQAVYTANSQGNYGRASTERIEAGGKQVSGYMNRERLGNPVCMLRTTTANDGKQFTPSRVIVLTDKPQKPLPAAVWEKFNPAPIVPALQSATVIA